MPDKSINNISITALTNVNLGTEKDMKLKNCILSISLQHYVCNVVINNIYIETYFFIKFSNYNLLNTIYIIIN